MTRLTLARDKIRVLLLEGVHDSAVATFAAAGYGQVERLDGALDRDELAERLASAHIVGIRSRTQLDGELLRGASKLFAIGTFCIGVNQVDLDAARLLGVPVFNAPYANTRSVAELVIGEIILLQRRVPWLSALAHAGVWQKGARGAHEVRGKVLGIVGYGHIGSQVSALAEAFGLQVRYHDIEPKLTLGNAQPCTSLDELLTISDIVTLHVPATELTQGMIGANEIARMKAGALLINASRGDVVDLDALAEALRGGHLSGAAVDVFPTEPTSAAAVFSSQLQGLDNVILTPHIGGNTEEAQEGIGREVADKLIRYSDSGSTQGAVNLVEVSLPVQRDRTRFLHIHHDRPGVLAAVNRAFSSRDLNIAGQYLRTDGQVGYVVIDVHGQAEEGAEIKAELEAIDATIRVRFLF